MTKKLNYNEIFDGAWNDLKKQLPLAMGLTVFYIICTTIFSFVPFVGQVLSAVLSLGYVNTLSLMRKNQEFDFKDFFWGFMNLNRFVHVMLLVFLVGFGTVLGYIMLIVPGVWFQVATIFAYVIFLKKDNDSVAAIKESIALAKDRWWNLAGLLCVTLLILLAGTACLLIGLLVACPLVVVMLQRAYDVLSESQVTPIESTTINSNGFETTTTTTPVN